MGLLQNGRINDPNLPSSLWGVNGLVPGDPVLLDRPAELEGLCPLFQGQWRTSKDGS